MHHFIKDFIKVILTEEKSKQELDKFLLTPKTIFKKSMLIYKISM